MTPTPYDDTDPFADPAQVPNAGPGIMQEWGQALQDPNVRGALLSAGLQLMQPQPFGQTFAGGVGQAIGAAGESVTAREKMDLAQTESESRASERESRAGDRESRARTAEQTLDFKKLQEQGRREDRQRRLTIAEGQAALVAEKVKRLQAEAAAGSVEAKADLTRAQAEAALANANLRTVRAEILPGELDIKQQNADTATGKAAAAAEAAKDPMTQAIKRQAEYRKGAALYTEYLKTLLPNQKAIPQQEWLKQQNLPTSSRDVGTIAPAEAAPLPTPPVTTAPQADEAAKARAAIAKYPAKEAELRRLYKQRTGQDLP